MDKDVQKFRNRFRVASFRLANFDYASPGAYFVTLCTKDRQLFFGSIFRGIVQLSQLGNLAVQTLQMIPSVFSFVDLGSWIVMPNHVHGILILRPFSQSHSFSYPQSRGAMNGASTVHGGVTGNDNPMINMNLARVIRWFKGRTTFMCRKIDPSFTWQARYHDRVIRNNDELLRIEKYIVHNPLAWERDVLFAEFLKEHKLQL